MEKPTAISKLSALLDTRGARSIDGTRFPNVDALYGPYDSKYEAWVALSTPTETGATALTVGKTVGIKENGKIVEYWFERNCTSMNDLVVKVNSSGSGGGGGSEDTPGELTSTYRYNAFTKYALDMSPLCKPVQEVTEFSYIIPLNAWYSIKIDEIITIDANNNIVGKI